MHVCFGLCGVQLHYSWAAEGSSNTLCLRGKGQQNAFFFFFLVWQLYGLLPSNYIRLRDGNLLHGNGIQVSTEATKRHF